MFARSAFRYFGFIVLLAVLTPLSAQQAAFELCRQKAGDAAIFKNGKVLLPVGGNLWLGYTSGTPPENTVRHDPFLGLYLVRRNKTFRYPYAFEKCAPESIAIIDETHTLQGHIKRRQVGLNTLASFSEPVQLPSLLSGCCCGIEGMVTERGIIEKAYVDHFLKHEEVLYGDIGIRVADSETGVIVTAVDPYVEGNPFDVGDRILSCGGKKVASAADLMRDILLSPMSTRLQVTYARGDETLSHEANVTRRYGGGLLSDTFLERLGLYFDQEGTVEHISEAAASMGIKEGDKILKIADQTISGRDDLLLAAGNMKRNTTLLIGRGGFSFFLRLP